MMKSNLFKKKQQNTHKIFERLLLWGFPFITDIHVPKQIANRIILLVSHTHTYHQLLCFSLEPADLLVKVSEEVDPECMLLVKFVSICILNSFKSLCRSSILQENVPA